MSDAGMILGQVRYANRGFWRTPVSAFFVLVFPLSFLVILSAIYGNEIVDPATGLRLAQYTTPVFAVFGVCMASFMSLAIAVAYARESGVLKRLRGTPLPPALHITGRLVSALWLSMLATAVMVGVGVAFYGVQVIWVNVPALVLTFLVGIACFTALGLAVAAVAPTPSAAQAFGNAAIILLSFISGIFGFTELPTWMDRLALIFPLKHFVDPAVAGFTPGIDAATPAWGDLAAMAAWGVFGAIVTWRAFRWEPTPGRVLSRSGRGAPRGETEEVTEEVTEDTHAVSGAGPVDSTVAAGTATGSALVITPGSPSAAALVGSQTRYAVLQVLRDPMSVFFAIAFPVLLVTFFSSMYGDEAQWGGLPLPQYLAAAFAVYGVATTGFVNLPGAIADQRARRVLTRLRGSPVPAWAYVTGRMLGCLALGLLTVGLIFAVGAAFFEVTLPPSTWAVSLLVFTLSICCFAACGLALVSLVDGPQAIIAAALCILLPLSFISDVFIQVDQLPTVLNAIAWAFPLRHAVGAAVTATSGGALDAAFWGHVAVVTAWLVAAALVAWRTFHWEPRRFAG